MLTICTFQTGISIVFFSLFYFERTELKWVFVFSPYQVILSQPVWSTGVTVYFFLMIIKKMFCFLNWVSSRFFSPLGHNISSLNNSVTDLLLLDIIHEANEGLLLLLFSARMSADFPWDRQSKHSWEEMHTLREKDVNLWGLCLRVWRNWWSSPSAETDHKQMQPPVLQLWPPDCEAETSLLLSVMVCVQQRLSLKTDN